MVIDTDVVHSFSLVEILTLCEHLGLQTMPTVLRIEETVEEAKVEDAELGGAH